MKNIVYLSAMSFVLSFTATHPMQLEKKEEKRCESHVTMHEAAEAGCFGCLHHLLETKADVNEKDILRGWSPLHGAVARGHTACIQLLLTHKAAVDAKNDVEVTHPVKHATAEAMKVLFHYGASLNSRINRGNCGNTPLHLAAERGHTECLHLLLEAKAAINSATTSGMTPLHYAAISKYPFCIHDLVVYGADSASKNFQAKTPQDVAGYKEKYHNALSSGLAERSAILAGRKHVIGAALKDSPVDVKELITLIAQYDEIVDESTRLAARKHEISQALAQAIDIKDLINLISTYDSVR